MGCTDAVLHGGGLLAAGIERASGRKGIPTVSGLGLGLGLGLLVG